LGFLLAIFLGVIGLQIEIEKIFSLVGIFISSKRSPLQPHNLEKLAFVNRNWPNGARVKCKSISNLVELIELKYS
jgi:hypothetical protein